MSKMKPGIWAGIVIFLIFLAMFIMSFQYAYSSNLGPGAGFFPVWISGILMLLSIWYIVETAMGKNTSENSWPKGEEFKNILFIVLCLFLFVIFFVLFGFILSSVLFLFLLFWKAYKWYTNLAISIGVSFLLYWLFNNVLGVILPVNGIVF